MEDETFNGSICKKFIDIGKIKDLIVNEYVDTYSVSLFMAFVVSDWKRLILLFDNY